MEKKPWQSKTIWMSLITAALPFIPGINIWVAANPEAFGAIVGLVFTGLRSVTKDKIVIK